VVTLSCQKLQMGFEYASEEDAVPWVIQRSSGGNREPLLHAFLMS